MTIEPITRLTLVELFGLADMCKRAGQKAVATELYKKWIVCHPDDPGLYAAQFNYGVSLNDAQDYFAAVIAFRESARLRPDFHPARISLGLALEKVGLAGQALVTWRGIAEDLKAVNADALTQRVAALENTGRVLEGLDQDAAAEAALRERLELAPDDKVAQHWIALRMRQCKWPILQPFPRTSRRDLLAQISPLSLANLADDPWFQLAQAAHYYKTLAGVPGIGVLPPPPPRRPGRLRIGYVSSDLREHAVGFCLVETLELHDRDRFEVFAYYCGIAREDATRARIKAAVDHWTDLNGLDDETAAARIRADGIDVLVDLNGYTKDARTRVFALQPAPVTVNWFGFPASMGSPHHHYIVADPIIVPPGAERYYSETVVRLPCYQPNDRKRSAAAPAPSRADEGLPDDAVVFCCLNGLQKLTAAQFACWLDILARVPAGILWLLGGTPETQARLRQQAAAAGIAPERLVFAAKKANPEHVARYALADLFLDCGPYGSHTTASDALWMGVPVLTCPGRSFAARVCASLVTAAGLPDLVCADRGAYVDKAVALGSDRAALSEVRGRLRDGRDQSLLFDTPRLVASLEAAFATMAQDHAAGRRPVPDLSRLDAVRDIALSLDVEATETMDDATYEALYAPRMAAWSGTSGTQA